jgi:hypothetical protein
LREPFGAEKHEPQAGHGEMDADGGNHQGQDAGIGQRLESESIRVRAQRRDDGQREQAVRPQGPSASVRPIHDCRDQDRQRESAHGRSGDTNHRLMPPQGACAVHDCACDRKCKHQPERPRHAPGMQRRERQRAERDELALRDEGDARDREDQHASDCQLHIDRAMCQSVDKQDAGK